MRASTFICTNIEEIERIKEENQRLDLPFPQQLPKPEYQESIGWFHPEDIARAYTRHIDRTAVATLFFSDGTYMDVRMTKEVEAMLDDLF
jgi:hypothetical protein